MSPITKNYYLHFITGQMKTSIGKQSALLRIHKLTNVSDWLVSLLIDRGVSHPQIPALRWLWHRHKDSIIPASEPYSFIHTFFWSGYMLTDTPWCSIFFTFMSLMKLKKNFFQHFSIHFIGCWLRLQSLWLLVSDIKKVIFWDRLKQGTSPPVRWNVVKQPCPSILNNTMRSRTTQRFTSTPFMYTSSIFDR